MHKYILITLLILGVHTTAHAYDARPSDIDTYILNPSKDMVKTAEGKSYYEKIVDQEIQSTQIHILVLQDYLKTLKAKKAGAVTVDPRPEIALEKARGCGITQPLYSGQPKNYSAGLNTTALQKALNTWQSQRPGKRLEYPQLVEDGIYGVKVTEFVKFYQRENGLQETGSVGPKTRALMNATLFKCS
ncbi:MAG: peptidoglycan-binding domain-containing protein [Minisyncoccia bacterium]